MGNPNTDFELLPHTIVYHISYGLKVTNKLLKNYDKDMTVFEGVMASLTKGKRDNILVLLLSNLGLFKLIPFANNTFSIE